MGETSRSARRAAVLVTVVLVALGVAPGSAAATFARRAVVTVDRAQVPGVASLTDFPVLISLASNDLRTTTNGGFVASSEGHDVIFQGEDAATCAPSSPPCRLDHEIESYDGTAGTIVAWVRVPALAGSLAGADTRVYMYYGDSTLTCSQENAPGVWDSSYREVFHLHEPAEQTDSTKNAFTAAGRGAIIEEVPGIVGPAVDLQGGAGGATRASYNVSDGTLPTATSFTLEAWVNLRSFNSGQYIGFLSKGREALSFDGDPYEGLADCTVPPCGDWTGLYLQPDGSGNDVFAMGWAWEIPAACKALNLADPRGGAGQVAPATWYHVAATFDWGTSTRRLLVNGVQVTTDTVGACIEDPIPHYTRLGTDSNLEYLDGLLDEVRISFAARSNAWIATGYNNQSNPPGFYSSIVPEAGSWTVGATVCPAVNPCAGGPGTCYLRSIGDTALYATGSGTCSAANGSPVVTCPGAGWVSANRGRGDRITIDGSDYMVLIVDGETQLRLSRPFTGVTGGNKSYTMSRQFATPQAWEDCISTGGATCPWFPVADGDLVAGSRSEIGVLYKDTTYTAAGANIVDFSGATTDPSHTITLTADRSNRHYGISGAGVVFDNAVNTSRAVVIQDQYVTVEWLEVRDGAGAGTHCIDFVPADDANHAVIRNNLVRNCSGHGIRIAGSASTLVADITNNVIYRGAREGVRIQSPLGTGTGSRVRILNNTFFRNSGTNTEVRTAETPNPYVVLRNNIFVDDTQSPDVTWNGSPPCTNAATCDWWNAASSNNVTGDPAPPTGQWQSDIGPNPWGGGLAGASEASLSFVDTTAGNEDLHLVIGSAAFNRGVDLSGVVRGDIDAEIRTAPWDAGADELPAAAAPPVLVYSDNAGAGTRPLKYTTYSGTTWAAPGLVGVTGPFHDMPLHQKVATTSPDGTRRAAVWSEDNPGQRDYLYASLWDGTSWDDGTGAPFGDAQAGFGQPCLDGALNVRCFDAAYEQQSGRLLVAYGVNLVNTINHARYDGTWTFVGNTSIGGLIPEAPTIGSFAFIELAARPGSNQIALVGIANEPILTPVQGSVQAAIWDGDAGTWGSQQVLSLPVTDGQNAQLTEAADVEFVLGGANAGEVITVWGNGTRVYSARWSLAGGWTAGLPISDLGAANTVRWLRLAAQPHGAGMVLAIEDTNQRLLTQTYDATTRIWGPPSGPHTTSAYGAALDNRPFDVVWDTAAGAASVLLVYSDTTRARFRTSSDGGATWGPEQDQDTATVRQAWWAQLVRDPGGTVHLALQDQADALPVYTWDGSSWLTPAVVVSGNTERDANHAVEPHAIATYPPEGGAADLGIAKDDGQVTAVPGTPLTYTLTVTNHGPGLVTSLFVNDTVPVTLTGAVFTPSTGAYDDGTGEWTGLSLAPTESVQLTLAGAVDPLARGNIVNDATVSPPAFFVDANGANDFASDTDTLDPSADVGIVKADDIDPAPLGGLLTYTLTVTNNGPSGATNVDVSDPLPADMDLDTAAGAITPSQGVCSFDVPTRTVSCSLGDLAPLAMATVTIRVRPGAVRTFDNTASVAHADPDPVSGNDSDNETTLVEVSGLSVRFLTATSTSQRNVLEWVNPTDTDYISTEIVVRGDRFPTGPGDGASIFNSGVSGGRDKLPHDTGALSNGQTFYYGVFVHRALPPVVSPGRFVSGRPFDHAAGPVKWAFSTGATALAAPTVGGAGVIATSNDHVVYAMERGADDDQIGVDSGEWPASFQPIALGGPVQHRSPVIPITVGTSNPVAYLGAQDGSVYVVDAAQGGSAGFPWGPTSLGASVQAAPAGIFTAFLGTLDYLLVGTRDGLGPNELVALDPHTGVFVDSYDNGGAGAGAIGIISGMAAVDYGPPFPPRVYFASHERTPVGSTNTLWCLELSGSVPVFNLLWARPLGDIGSSPVLRGDRVYVGSAMNGGTVYSLDKMSGGDDRTFIHGNGQVKGFVFPDRASSDIYFATDDLVWGVTDTGAAAMPDSLGGPVSLPAGAKPSPLLFVPGSHYLYVGGSDGQLHEIDVLPVTPTLKAEPLGNGLAGAGAPSLDRGHDLIHLGTEAGIFYAVQTPLP